MNGQWNWLIGRKLSLGEVVDVFGESVTVRHGDDETRVLLCELLEEDYKAQDHLIGSATFCLIPFGHWAPVPEWCVEEYEPRAKRRGWRLNERGAKLFSDMGWQRTDATTGDA